MAVPDSSVPPNPITPYLLQGMELATAIVFGVDPEVAPLELGDEAVSARQALERVVGQALRRPPCVVGFSGGRDSSALLALAAHIARRDGLEPPLAATNVFSGDVQASESEWQELMVADLQIAHWERFRFTHELDVVGPVAAPLLRRFGPTFPFNGHFGMPSFALAAGGTYLTGVGGDEVFEPNELTALALALTRKVPLRRAYLRTALRQMGPSYLRARRYRSLVAAEPWLQPEASRRFTDDLSEVLAHQRVWFANQVRFDVWRERSRAALERTLGAFGALLGTTVIHPFQDPAFLGAVARRHRYAPWKSRAAAMTELFGDVLHEKVRSRRTKASFDSIFFSDYSREFASTWDGSGVDTSLVSVEGLRAAWSAPAVDARSLSVLQAAWLATTKEAGGAGGAV